MRTLSYLLLVTFALLLSACSVTSPEMNRPLSVKSSDKKLEIKPVRTAENKRSDELTL